MNNSNKTIVNDEVLISIGKDIDNIDVRDFARICAVMIKLYAKKNKDYGNSFDKGVKELGVTYGVGRLYDKMNRLINLTKSDVTATCEPVEDTIIDMACYSVMLYKALMFNNSNDTSLTGESKN